MQHQETVEPYLESRGINTSISTASLMFRPNKGFKQVVMAQKAIRPVKGWSTTPEQQNQEITAEKKQQQSSKYKCVRTVSPEIGDACC